MANKKEKVALSSVFASAAMTMMKLAVGLLTGSLGILSEAAHSLLDLGAASLTWIAVRVSDKPADQKHPYGHGKVENISALIETGLLFLTSGWIIKEGVDRLLADKVEVKVTWYGVAVILISIVIDFTRARALSKVAKETGSQALEADALHFSSDILSSLVVLCGLGFVALGWKKGDAVAAIGVACFVLSAGYRLGKRTIDVLIDTAPVGTADRIGAIAAAVPGVAHVQQIRARPGGTTIFAEAILKVGRGLALEQVEAVRREVVAKVQAELPNVALLVVAEPLALDDEGIAETVQVTAAAMGLAVHDISILFIDGRRVLGFDLEVEETLSLQDAHAIASSLEERLLQAFGSGIAIDIHIDPSRRSEDIVVMPAADEAARITTEIRDLLSAYPMVRDMHHLTVQCGRSGYYIAFHCIFPKTAAMKAIHEITASIERDIRARIARIDRVVIHAEPDALT